MQCWKQRFGKPPASTFALLAVAPRAFFLRSAGPWTCNVKSKCSSKNLVVQFYLLLDICRLIIMDNTKT